MTGCIPERRTARPRSGARLLGLLLSSFIVSGALLLAELVVLPSRLALSREAYLMGFAATPGALVDDTRINEMGFTGDVLDLDKPEGTIRILTLGGSSLFNRRLTDRLKERLDATFETPCQVLGAALRMHTTMSSLLKYRMLSKYDFDYVLIYDSINDLWANDILPEDFRSDYSHLNSWYRRNLLLDNSLICRMVYNRWIYRQPPFVMLTAFSSELPGLQAFARNTADLIELVLQSSVPIVMTFAWRLPHDYSLEAFHANELGYNNPTYYDQCPVEIWGSSEYVRAGLEYHSRVVRRIVADRGVLMIDQEKLLGDEPSWFGDVCHLSEEGTARFIDNIVAFFQEHGLMR